MKWIYKTNKDNTNRYVLGQIKEGKDSNPLICFGINPSTATPNKLDNTIKSVQRLSESNGFNGWIMLNIYPQRATDPKDLHKEIDSQAHIINLDIIKDILIQKEVVIWAAWGTLIKKRNYLPNCLKDIIKLSEEYNCKWVSLGKISKNGHPHHPLYLRKDTKYDDFNIAGYIENLK